MTGMNARVTFIIYYIRNILFFSTEAGTANFAISLCNECIFGQIYPTLSNDIKVVTAQTLSLRRR